MFNSINTSQNDEMNEKYHNMKNVYNSFGKKFVE